MADWGTSMPTAASPPHGGSADSLLRLRMPSRREAIAPTVEQIVAATGRAGLDADQRANLTVALSEALSNAVVHGHRQHHRRPVLIVVLVEGGRGVTVDVRDFGLGFDVAALLDCREGERVLATSGRGVFLMRHLVDRVEFNARGNRVRLALASRAARVS
jgi:serine/threonine-protein kinase RsbW